ncbi:Hypothetical predicted protein [Paramuricea clavata]|uniref:Uncharacterized protein n=1 Tax=Paramuricea clavata TaxID=317549 RepID=A0A7D9H9T7_PARCT|nr:Hypothetical predicted protein [Paramuricea clavata]
MGERTMVKFLRNVKGAKLTGNKCELISRVKGYIEHPDMLSNIQTTPEITLETALDIDSLHESCLQRNSARENIPFVSFETVERYVKTQEQAAQALQDKGYRMFASRKIVKIQTAIVDALLGSLGYVATFLQHFMHWRNIAAQATLH